MSASEIPEVTAENALSFIELCSKDAQEADRLGWYRGQADSSWSLLPSGFRPPFSLQSLPHMANEFRMKAPAVKSLPCPTLDDEAGWLTLMQHYRLPTTLLDWTRSPLVAAYFALDEKPTAKGDGPPRDGVVWRLRPEVLNRRYAGVPAAVALDAIALAPLRRVSLLGTSLKPGAIAAAPVAVDLRVMTQRAAFTLHGDHTPMEQFPDAPKFLTRVVIPARIKPALRGALLHLGFDRASLFPDVENLALHIAEMERFGHGIGPRIAGPSSPQKP